RFAGENSIPLVSTTDAHLEDDAEFRDWPPHCVTGTLGQTKLKPTLLERRAVVPLERCEFQIAGAQQIVIEKRSLDCFTNPNLETVLAKLGAERYVVYGVVTEYCVRCAVNGLLRSGKQVEVVTDAIQALKPEDGQRTLDEFAAAGVRLTTVDSIFFA
ncbi:MAG: cysteine hydrolase, partial [bacterium]|nr:cysteine hydrolase [bacterium]